VFGSLNHRFRLSAHLGAYLGVYLGAVLGGIVWASPLSAEAVRRAAQPAKSLDTILVTAQRQAADEEVRGQVESALNADPFFNDEHVTVTIKDGVVTLHGIVFDEWDLRAVKRIARRIPGVRRVVDDLEIKLGGE
jgi:osmotically-inducible protein OsmY